MTLGLWVYSHLQSEQSPLSGFFQPPAVRLAMKITDYEKWQQRPSVPVHDPVANANTGLNGMPPCLFIVPPGTDDQPISSGDVGDCLLLVPDGRKMDVLEVALQSGTLMHIKTDLYLPDVIPLAFTRVAAPLNDWARRNRITLPHVYDLYLTGSRYPYTYVDWRLPDGQTVHYNRISAGTGFADALYERTVGGSPIFTGSRMAWNGWGWDLALENGLTYLSPEAYFAKRPQQGSLVGIFDRNGNEVRLTRNGNGDLTDIRSPGGHSISLFYSAGRVSVGRGSEGRSVRYDYDSEDRLSSVTDSSGQTIRYFYDSWDRITKIEDSSGGDSLDAQYGSGGSLRVSEHGQSYSVSSADHQGERIFHISVADANGKVRVFTVEVPAYGATTSYRVEENQDKRHPIS